MREGWNKVSLNELGTVGRGKSRHRPRNAEFLYNGPYPFIQTGDIEAARFYINSYSQTYSESGLAQSKLWPKGTLCISIVGANTGASAILGFDACFPDSVICFTPDSEKSDVKFIKYALELMRFELKSISQGAARENLSLEKLLSIKFSVPEILLQKRIVSIINPFDTLIENNLKRIKLLEEKAQITYEEWFVKMRFPGYETAVIDEVTGLPEGWENIRFGDFVKTSSGGTPSRKKEAEFYEGGSIPWVRTGELKNFMLIDSEQLITPAGLKSSSAKLFPKNTVLLAMYGNTIGETSYVTFETSTNQACCGFLVEEKSYLSYFIHQYLLFNKEQILSHRMGAAQENISQSIIQNIKINLPIQNLLMDFGDLVGQNYKMIEILLNQNSLLKEARDILLPRLMSGMIDVEEFFLPNKRLTEELQKT